MLTPDAAVLQARQKWGYRGTRRPDFAEPVSGSEESVWDFPRPPRIEPVAARLRVMVGTELLAETRGGVRVVETAGAPTYYFPPEDVATARAGGEPALIEVAGRTLCEWKGYATTFGTAGVSPAAWCYRETFPEFAAIQNWFGFYPGRLHCFVGTLRARPQPGGYYGGWVTNGLKGPIKGLPGTEHW